MRLIFLVILFSISILVQNIFAQTLQKSQDGTFIILLPDGAYIDYDSKNKDHKALMAAYEKKHKNDKKEVKPTEKKSEKIVESKQELLEKKKSELLSAMSLAYQKEKLMANAAEQSELNYVKSVYDYKKFVIDFPEKKKSKEALKLENWSKELEKNKKKAFSNFSDAQKESDKLRKELSKIKVDTKAYSAVKLTKVSPIEIKTEKKEVAKKTESSVKKDKKPTAKKEDKKIENPKKEKKDTAKSEVKKTEKKVVAKTEKPTTKKEEKKKDEKGKAKVEVKKTTEPNKKSENILSKPVKETEATVNKAILLKDAENVAVNPPFPSCEYAFEGLDEFTKVKRKETVRWNLFKHTDDVMLKYYEKNDFLTCDVSASRTDKGFKYFTFFFTFNSDNVQNTYGVLEKDNVITLRFLDGSYMPLYNSKTDRGAIDPIKKTTTYKAVVPLNTNLEKQLFSGEIDQIRVLWGTGTDDYAIYDLDFFSNLMNCIK